MAPWQDFAGRSVLVVGGCTGIGAGIARAFAGAGALVTVTAVSERELAQAQGAAARHLLDVRDRAAVEALVGGMSALDHVVCTAGIIRRGDEHDPEVFDAVLDVNLSGSMRVAAAARPQLAARGGGTILLTASMLSFFGGGLVPGYSASKGGIAQLTRSLAIAYAAEGIRVNALAPGWIATDLTRAVRDDAARSAAILGRTPLGRWGQPDDLGGAALFLASPAASFITGVVLPVDGGYLAA